MRERSILARTAIVLLNLLVPGLGVLRVDRWQMALPFIAVPLLLSIIVGILAAYGPVFTLPIFVMILIGGVLILLVTIIRTWRMSGSRPEILHFHQRWYAVFACLVAVWGLGFALPSITDSYHSYYAAAESMQPGLLKNDKLMAYKRDRSVHRGDIVIVSHSDGNRIARVAGLPGDRIAMRDDSPVINGQPSTLSNSIRQRVMDFEGWRTVTRSDERFPGEPGHHAIWRFGEKFFSDMPEITVPAGQIFLLGDNRDRAADSRVPMWQQGAGPIFLNQIIGHALFITWSKDHSRIGASLEPGK